MVEQQMTFYPLVGLPPVVPTRPHPDDDIICEDGRVCKRRDAYADCKGGWHYTDELRRESNVAIVRDFLTMLDEWVCDDYVEHDDYASGAYHIVDEVSHDWPSRVEEWVRDTYGDVYGHTKYDDCMEKLVEAMCEDLAGSHDCEPEHDRSDYAAYHGDGCCLWSYDIGEVEWQTDINGIPELKALHDSGELDDCFDELDCEFCIGRRKRREKNEETGKYERVGRETYDPFGSDCPCFETYHNAGGQWHYVVSADRMNQALSYAVCQLCRS